ncbi:hypothetical protein DPMN_162010 [Dreissena polymorpha]|uniref:Uncharacterized protein n=1 Tax=Dreissena polymorpha TaxID=45954 RepID=A0A9D4ENQ7_DREPO|nr:hypothetical protein DPMN_162010 [Dreissena polymorpha]
MLGRYRLSPGLKRGTTSDNRGSAGASPEITLARPGLPGRCRDVDRLQPGQHREKV